MSAETCPHCGASMLGDPISPKALASGMYGPIGPNEPPRFYRRYIGVEIRGLYDGVCYWLCPDCGGTWDRFPEGHRLHGKRCEAAES
jgi:hypothetical protein